MQPVVLFVNNLSYLSLKNTLHYRKIWLLLGIIYILLILLGSLAKIPESEIQFSGADKIIHFSMYFILVGWFSQLYEKNSSRLIILLLAMLLGLLIEILQGLTAYRSFDYLDEVANSIGAICAFLLLKTSLASSLAIIDSWIAEKLIRE